VFAVKKGNPPKREKWLFELDTEKRQTAKKKRFNRGKQGEKHK